MAAIVLSVPAHYQKIIFKQQTVGTSEVQITQLALPSDAFAKAENVLLQALSTNTGIITVGKTGVTNGGAGIEMVAGANISLPTHMLSEIYLIASGAGQKLNITYMTAAN